MAVDLSCSEDQHKEQNIYNQMLLALVDTARIQVASREYMELQKYNFLNNKTIF